MALTQSFGVAIAPRNDQTRLNVTLCMNGKSFLFCIGKMNASDPCTCYLSVVDAIQRIPEKPIGLLRMTMKRYKFTGKMGADIPLKTEENINAIC